MTDYNIPGYRIEGTLGKGGMASVFLARQESLNRLVALKIMSPALSANEDFKTRFINEGRIVAQLSHNHIVTVYDIGSHGQQHYLTMEYLPGGTLRERIRSGLSLKHAVRIALALADALYYAHQRNVIHRDIKPINVLFRANNTPVLTDFGIAKILSDGSQLTQAGFAIGSAGYMSPEQALGRSVDQRADIYALGVLFWEMLTGKPPFQADDTFALALKHATEPLPDLPAKLARFQPLFARLLAKQPEDRYSSLDKFIHALKAVNQLLDTPATPAAPPATAPVSEPPADPEMLAETRLMEPPTTASSSVSTALHWVEREQRRLLLRLPDYIEALRLDDVAEAGEYLQLCDELLQTAYRLSQDYLQTLGTRSLGVNDFARLHTAMDCHARFSTLARQLLEFCHLALLPVQGESLRELKNNMIEGLDAILLILQDAVHDADDPDAFATVRLITGDRSEMMNQLRQSYLTDATLALSNADKMLLLKVTGQFERLMWALSALIQRL